MQLGTRWESVLKKRGETHIHMNEDRYHGMSVLMGELFDTIQRASQFGMRSAAATVELGAHRKLSSECAVPVAGRICAEVCINELTEDSGSISCFFDRGEEFFREVNRRWEPDSPDDWPQLSKVRALGQVLDSRDCPGVQAADLLAWHVNRGLTKCDRDLELALLANRAPGVFKLFDEEALRARLREGG